MLFYFTGHGDYANDDFFYILSDFDFDKRTQTSLQNSELDGLIKSLNPKLVVKIVDACHSGVNYIKDIKAIDTYIKSTINQFKNCYFLYSSLNTQNSFQDNKFSFFTLSFLNAIKNYQEKDVRYKNIIDYISDEFIDYPEQTPFFVTQADFTEIFCSKNESIISFTEKYNAPTIETLDSAKNDSPNNLNSHRIEDLIKGDAQKHISLEEVNDILGEIKQIIEGFELEDDIKNLFKIEIKSTNYIDDDEYSKIIGKYVDSKKHQYFATPNFDTERYTKVEIPALSLSDKIRGKSDKPYNVELERQIIVGYSLSSKYLYMQLHIELESKLPKHQFIPSCYSFYLF